MLPRLSWISCAVVLVLMVSSRGSAQDSGKKAPAPPELKALLTEAIKLLNSKDYEKLLERMVEPEQKAKFKEDKIWAEVIKKFGETHAEKLLKILKIVVDAEPKLNEKSTEAVYELPKDLEAPRSSITFVKISDVWYLRN